ncbi:MAG: NUDIX hydrolase [Acidimicrobiales bacterium]|nr:NUDIX hydrolase [Acidimicrobiales bacterium]|tara:strand:+ start:94 stop:831 length:738 start_codon:yes stop_codon:yes gene_type:complete
MNNRDESRYKKWESDHEERGTSDLIPAATVVIMRDSEPGIELLMLRKNSKVAFGGMWVFPGGKIDETDKVIGSDGSLDELATATNAAARETFEEAAISVSQENLFWFSHWVPPAITPKRFSTYFFATKLLDGDEVTIDDSEIIEHNWFRPHEAIDLRDAGEIELAPPTWVTLNRLISFTNVENALNDLDAKDPIFYETHIAQSAKGPVAMWFGDAGYEKTDPDMPGERHRLTMTTDGYHFEQSNS